MPRAALVGAAVLLGAVSLVPAAARAADDGPLAVTRSALERSNAIVRGAGDRKQKLLALRDLLRDFLDTEALARLAAGKHLEGRSPEETAEFLRLFREMFIRTYVQRLLLFDAPDFAYGAERVTGETATVGTEIVTPRDRFAVDYAFRRTPNGWRVTDILVEQVSLAKNFRAQFDSALAKDSFQSLLERLKKKVDQPETSSRVEDGEREFGPRKWASVVPRPAKPARQTVARSKVSTYPPPSQQIHSLVTTLTFRNVCRAGFAGRGTTFARSTERGTLAAAPRRSLGAI